MDIQIGNPQYTWLGCGVLVVAGLLIWSGWAQRRAERLFFPAGRPVRLNRWSVWRSACLLATVSLLWLGTLDIRWGKTTQEVPQRGIEIVFALDVSRSMMAEDAKPNRLGRAKQQIKEMVNEMGGDRIGLVIFAGEAKRITPLTSHYNDFRQALDAVDPSSLTRGGSQLGVAIEGAAEAFLSKTSDHKTIVLFTDGEDQESQPVSIARRLHKESGVRVFTVGLGDMDRGAVIPDAESSRGFVQHEGETVLSKQNGEILRDVATESKGAYIPAGTKHVDMGAVYHKFINNIPPDELGVAKIDTYQPRFAWFVAPALFLMVLELWWSTRRHKQQQERSESNGLAAAASAATMWGVLLLAPHANGQELSVETQINEANQLLRSGRFEDALAAYDAVERVGESEHQDRLAYNRGVANYQLGNLESARELFARTAKSNNTPLATASRFNLGNCDYAAGVDADPEQAIAALRSAILHYRSALRLQPEHQDARANLELAARLLRQLREQQQQNQQPNQQSSDDSQQNESGDESQPPQDSNDSKGDSDSDSKSDSKEQENKENQTDAQPSDASQSGDSQQQDDSGDGGDSSASEGDDPKDEPRPNQPQDASDDADSPANPKAKDASEESTAGQNSEGNDENRPTDPAPSSGNEEQPETPDGQLEAASADSQDDPESSQSSQAKKGVVRMTREEALKLLQAVRDRDLIRRLQKQQQQRNDRFRVEKDW